MTSSEQTATARVLAEGHLHPGMLFLRFVDGLRQSLLPVIVGIVVQQTWLVLAAGVAFVLRLGVALIRYVSFRYRLTEDELVTTEGVLHRQERRIPVDRIHDLNYESTLLRRIFGLVLVSVETASGQGVEARLDSLARRDAEMLREALHWLRTERRGALPEPSEAAPELLLYRASSQELALLGLTSNRVGAVLLALFGVVELAEELGLGRGFAAVATGVFGGLFAKLSTFAAPVLLLLVVGFLFLLLLAGWLLSVTASLVMYHGFTLTERDEVLHRRYGLITTRSQSLPRRKIQRILLEAPALRELFGVVTLRADSAGSGMGEDQEAGRAGARDVIVPLTRRANAEMLVPWLLPGLAPEPLPWHRVSSKVVVRVFFKSVLLAVVLLAIGLPSVGLPALAALIVLPFGWLFGVLAYRNLAWAFLGDHVAFRWGILGRFRAFIPLRKVQAAVLRAGPFDRRLGLARLTVYVAGGSPSTLGNLPRDVAEWLVHEVAHAAARSRFVW